MTTQDLKQPDDWPLPRAWGAALQSVSTHETAKPLRATNAVGLVLAALILLPLTVAAVLLQLDTYPNHDVAWILWGTREMLAGAQWGVDIIEPNPPLAWYLSIPTTAAALWLDIPLDWTFRIAVAVAAACSAGCFAWLLCRPDFRVRYAVLCATAGLCLLLLSGREFGQREHLLAIAILPYLALTSQRIGQRHVSTLAAVGTGLAAGLGVALKPYFLAVPICVEIAVQLLSRRHVPLFRAENVAMGLVVAAYVISLLAFEQSYLKQVVPLANDIYWSFNRPWTLVWSRVEVRFFAAIPFAAYALYKRDAVGVIFAAAFCGFAASYFVQHKAYPYHLLPVSIITFLLLAHVATSARILIRVSAIVVLYLFAAMSFRPVADWWDMNRPGGARAAEIGSLRDSIAANVRNGHFLIVTTHPYPTFPTAIYTSAKHVSRTNSHWFLPAVVQNRTDAKRGPNAAAIERHAREFMLHDLAAKPDLVLIDTDSARHTVSSENFDFLAFYLEDPAFRAEWRNYREIRPIGTFRQFVRARPNSQLQKGSSR